MYVGCVWGVCERECMCEDNIMKLQEVNRNYEVRGVCVRNVLGRA